MKRHTDTTPKGLILDRALREVAGGQTPPDISERVAVALKERKSAGTGQGGLIKLRRTLGIVLAAACFIAGLALIWLPGRDGPVKPPAPNEAGLTGVIKGDAAKVETDAAGMRLDHGWLLLGEGSGPVKTEGPMVKRNEGRVLVCATLPDGLRGAAAIGRELSAKGVHLNDDEARRLVTPEAWRVSGGVAICALSGGAAVDGENLAATQFEEELRPREYRAPWMRPDTMYSGTPTWQIGSLEDVYRTPPTARSLHVCGAPSAVFPALARFYALERLTLAPGLADEKRNESFRFLDNECFIDVAFLTSLDTLTIDNAHTERVNSVPDDPINDDGIAKLAALTNLRSLSFIGLGYGVTGDGIAALAALSQLREFNAAECVIDDGWMGAISRMTALESLTLGVRLSAGMGASEVSPPSLALLGAMPRLHTLNFTGETWFKEADFAALASMTTLQTLNLHNGQRIGDDALAQLGRLTSLRRLDLGRWFNEHVAISEPVDGDSAGPDIANNITSDGVARLSGLIEMETLDLSGSRWIDDRALETIGRLTNLRELSLRGCFRISDAGMAHLSGLMQLTSLDIGFCPKVSANGLRALRGMGGLRRLMLDGTGALNDDGAVILGATSSLQELGLAATGITGGNDMTDAGLASIARLTSLRTLNISGFLGHCVQEGPDGMPRGGAAEIDRPARFTDEGLRALTALDSLEELAIQHCPGLTDAGLSGLGGMARLRRVNLYHNHGLSREGIRQLMTTLYRSSGMDSGIAITAPEGRELTIASEKLAESSLQPDELPLRPDSAQTPDEPPVEPSKDAARRVAKLVERTRALLQRIEDEDKSQKPPVRYGPAMHRVLVGSAMIARRVFYGESWSSLESAFRDAGIPVQVLSEDKAADRRWCRATILPNAWTSPGGIQHDLSIDFKSGIICYANVITTGSHLLAHVERYETPWNGPVNPEEPAPMTSGVQLDYEYHLFDVDPSGHPGDDDLWCPPPEWVSTTLPWSAARDSIVDLAISAEETRNAALAPQPQLDGPQPDLYGPAPALYALETSCRIVADDGRSVPSSFNLHCTLDLSARQFQSGKLPIRRFVFAMNTKAEEHLEGPLRDGDEDEENWRAKLTRQELTVTAGPFCHESDSGLKAMLPQPKPATGYASITSSLAWARWLQGARIVQGMPDDFVTAMLLAAGALQVVPVPQIAGNTVCHRASVISGDGNGKTLTNLVFAFDSELCLRDFYVDTRAEK